jgi:hypothetical protein
MRIKQLAFALTCTALSIPGLTNAQDPRDELYGQAVHSFFRGDRVHAEELLNEIISEGSEDPRAYFFRGLCQTSYNSIVGENPDFERGAQLEQEGARKVVNVGKALERVQGPARVAIEKARIRARLAARTRAEEMRALNKANLQPTDLPADSVRGGILVPPRAMDPAPLPGATGPAPLAPNDPFNAGMTKGDPKAMPGDAKPADDFGTELPTTPMPETTPTAPAEEDPFK